MISNMQNANINDDDVHITRQDYILSNSGRRLTTDKCSSIMKCNVRQRLPDTRLTECVYESMSENWSF